LILGSQTKEPRYFTHCIINLSSQTTVGDFVLSERPTDDALYNCKAAAADTGRSWRIPANCRSRVAFSWCAVNTPSRKRRRERTFASELVVLDESDLLALHASRTVAARTARLDGVTLQVLGQPAQVAVADERVASQVPTHTHTHTHTTV